MRTDHHPCKAPTNKEAFQEYVTGLNWRFAKSVPNWPHFYIVEEELEDRLAYVAARTFISEHGYDGNFFDMNVRYLDAGVWTYWSSPLAEPLETQYMLNRCRTEYTWNALAKAGELPPEGFTAQHLSLAPVLEDPEFQALVRKTSTGSGVPGTRNTGWQGNVLRRHRKIFHCLPHLLDEDSIRQQCTEEELEQIKTILAEDKEPTTTDP